ncbi:MAG: thiamine-phosphate kinase [Kineosporiaceae bacterium]|nr:thiamine-phosphate kinase [Kineosporiaceae bacterium]
MDGAAQDSGQGVPLLADLGEDRLVSAVLAAYPPSPPWVLTGPGDDAAVVELTGRVVISTDTLVEGRDFRWDWSSAHDVGVKVAAQTLADIAAMGARPMALLVSLAAPGSASAAMPVELARGLAAECARAGAAMIGGDVSSAAEVVLTGTAFGVLDGPRPAVLRSGARPGDVVAISGPVGASAAGLELLLAGAGPAGRDPEGSNTLDAAVRRVLSAHRAPRPDYPAGVVARDGGAGALIDTSDGLVRDATRLAAASGVVIEIDSAAIPGEAALPVVAEWLGGGESMVRSWQLTGGEDHALLACFPPGLPLPSPFVAIGRVRAGEQGDRGVVLVDGVAWQGRPGWTHW